MKQLKGIQHMITYEYFYKQKTRSDITPTIEQSGIISYLCQEANPLSNVDYVFFS